MAIMGIVTTAISFFINVLHTVSILAIICQHMMRTVDFNLKHVFKMSTCYDYLEKLVRTGKCLQNP